MELLQVHYLTTSYPGHVALKGVSFSVGEGEIVGLWGPNKAGKTTLCKCLAGTKSTDDGDIFFNNHRINQLSISQRLSLGLSLCPERSNEAGEANPIYLNQSVEFNFEVLRKGPSRHEWQAGVNQVLSYFPPPENLTRAEYMKRIAGTLSGGEAQMLGIARKLVCLLNYQVGPRLLIIDEPARGLSQQKIDSLFQALDKIRRNANVSILLVEEFAQRLSGVDRIYILADGLLKNPS